MKRVILTCLLAAAPAWAAAPGPELRLPAFPVAAFVEEGGRPKEMNSMRLLREVFRGGVRIGEQFDTVDADYGLLRQGSVEHFAAWLETACQGFGFDLFKLRSRVYDAATFSRLLEVAASLGALQDKTARPLAVPIGLLLCKRDAAWGELGRDGSLDAYIVFATESGIMVYDPPTRQLTNLADYPNKAGIQHIRF
jgi:hypothetical protein